MYRAAQHHQEPAQRVENSLARGYVSRPKPGNWQREETAQNRADACHHEGFECGDQQLGQQTQIKAEVATNRGQNSVSATDAGPVCVFNDGAPARTSQ